MQRVLTRLLPDATSASGFVVAMNLDIRGFSAFATTVDPSFAMIYLRKLYLRLIETYLPPKAFFKLTGDGMLVVVPFEEADLTSATSEVVSSALRIVDDFSTMCKDDPMLPFEQPSEMGIGIAWGTASSLVSKRSTLDYSGHPLNLASRLMELARPSGVVLGSAVPIELFAEATAKQFVQDTAYIKGLAEVGDPHVFHRTDRVVVPPSAKLPIGIENWHDQVETSSLKELRERGYFALRLEEEPVDRESGKVMIQYIVPTASGRRSQNSATLELENEYFDTYGYHSFAADLGKAAKEIAQLGVKEAWPLTIRIRYRVA